MPCQISESERTYYDNIEAKRNRLKQLKAFVLEVRDPYPDQRPYPVDLVSVPAEVTEEHLNAVTKALCSQLNVRSKKWIQDNLSLELQIWWRDHQESDKKRKANEILAPKEPIDTEKLVNLAKSVLMAHFEDPDEYADYSMDTNQGVVEELVEIIYGREVWEKLSDLRSQ